MKDPMFVNKIIAAALTTGLLAVGLPIVISSITNIVGGDHSAHASEENPFGVAYMPTEIKIDGVAMVEKEVLSLPQLLANASVKKGERAAAICASCHTFEKGGADGTGPNLWGVLGREIASKPGFSYSEALQAKDGVWTYDKIDPFLQNSQAYVPGTAMAQMIRKDEKRADILAFLQTLSDDPVPFPTEDAAPAEDEAPADDTETL